MVWKNIEAPIRNEILEQVWRRILDFRFITKTRDFKNIVFKTPEVVETYAFPYRGTECESDICMTAVSKYQLVDPTRLDENDRPTPVSPEGTLRKTYRVESGDERNHLHNKYPEALIPRFVKKMRLMRDMANVLQGLYEHETAHRLPEPLVLALVTTSGRVITIPLEEWEKMHVLLLTPFVSGLESYWSFLKAHENERSINKEEQGRLKMLGKVFARFHGLPIGMNSDEQMDLYGKTMDFMLGRIHLNLRLQRNPELPQETLDRFYALSYDSFKAYGFPYARACRTWLDAHGWNVLWDAKGNPLVTDPQTDTHFAVMGEPGADIATLVTDLKFRKHATGITLHDDRWKIFLDSYEKESGDAGIRRAIAHIGIPYRTAINLNPSYISYSACATVEELKRAGPFVEEVSNIIASGTL